MQLPGPCLAPDQAPAYAWALTNVCVCVSVCVCTRGPCPLPSLHPNTGALPVAMYSPADLSAVMALQQQQQLQDAEAAEEMQARALKRPRLVWTPQLHKLFEEAVAKIGINKAVPKTIMQVRLFVCSGVCDPPRAVCGCGWHRGKLS